MMHSFDGGSPVAMFSALAEGYRDLLEPLRWRSEVEPGPRGPYLKTLGFLLRPPDASILESGGHEIIGALPSCLIEIGEGRTTATQPDHLIWEIDVRVHIIAGHEAMEPRGRLFVDDSPGRSTANDPGIFTMMQHVIEELHYRQPTIQASRIRVEGTSYGADTPKWSWWAVDTRVECRQNIWRQRDAEPVDAIAVTTESPASDTVTNEVLF